MNADLATDVQRLVLLDRAHADAVVTLAEHI